MSGVSVPRPLFRSTLLIAASISVLGLVVGCAPASPEAEPGNSQSPSATTSATPAPTQTATAAPLPENADADFAALEAEFDARLGVYALEVNTGRSVGYRPDDRFAFASTIKALAAGATLQQNSAAQLDELIPITAADIASYSPVTEKAIGTSMSIRDLGAAAVQYSDSTALNLLVERLGGTDALQQILLGIGDETTSTDRLEPALNDTTPGDIRDTSSPRQLALDLEAFGLGGALPEPGRTQFVDWLTGNTTGDALIRAGVPEGWTVGDKTGAAAYATRNDIGILWPPSGSPIVIAVMSDRTMVDAPYNDALIAEATRVVVNVLG